MPLHLCGRLLFVSGLDRRRAVNRAHKSHAVEADVETKAHKQGRKAFLRERARE